MLLSLISRDRKRTVHERARSGMSRNVYNFSLMQRTSYFPIQFWPWCPRKECWARRSRDYFGGGVAEHSFGEREGGAQIPIVTPLSFRAYPLPRIRPFLSRTLSPHPLADRPRSWRISMVASQAIPVMEDTDLNSIQTILIKTSFIRLLYRGIVGSKSPSAFVDLTPLLRSQRVQRVVRLT